jgi:hypothetical protein
MTTFNLALDTTASMLLQLARTGVDRSTAFKVLDRVNLMSLIDIGPTIDTQPSLAVSVFDCGYISISPAERDVDLLWDGDRLVSSSDAPF